MITLPLPLVSSLILGFLFLRLLLQDARAPWVTALLGTLALQGVIITLAQHQDMAFARLVQPVSAMAIPALAWLAWKSDGLGRRISVVDTLHLLGPALALVLRWGESLMLEVLVPLAYAGYAMMLVKSLLRNEGDLPHGRLGLGNAPRLVWAGLAAALGLSSLSDLAIAAVIVLGQADYVPVIVDLATSTLLFGTGLLVLGVERVTGCTEADTPAPPVPSEDDHALFARLEGLMQRRRPWRDPDLTLSQLARRLAVPAKRLSVAVNLVTGDNISRYVNGHRIAAACEAMQDGGTITEAMLEAGFVTKSNFNREFRRVTGQTPTEWLACHGR